MLFIVAAYVVKKCRNEVPDNAFCQHSVMKLLPHTLLNTV